MARKIRSQVRSPTPPGDAVIKVTDRIDSSQQPLSERQKKLRDRAYQLFEHFRDELRDAHEEMRRARRMRQLNQDEQSRTSPLSNTLNSCIDHVIADQVDNMPEALLYAEREETAKSAEEMSDIVSYVLYHAGWPGKYLSILEDVVVTGTGIAEVLWDEDAEDGDGMVNVLSWHPEDFYPDPMYENLQDGRACFKATHTTVAWVEEHYPHAVGYVSEDKYTRDNEERINNRAADGDLKTTLIEFWYRRYDHEKRKYRVHMAQLAGGALLYSTELGFGGADEDEYKEGVYAHGLYPFTMYKYRQVWRKPFGTGLVHDNLSTQHAIDRYQKYLDDNARQSSIQRHFIRRGSGINADVVADLNNTIIEWDGNDIREVLQTVQAAPLNSQVYQMLTYMSDTMKQDCGQNQFARGEGGMGVTAATAIQALQESGGKTSRWHLEGLKDAFREMIEQVLWVLSEYIDPSRRFRIVGGWDSTGNMDGRSITLQAPRYEGDALLKPAYSVRVQVQRNNPLQMQADNEYLLQVAQMCAQYGSPMPPSAIVNLMQGYRNKQSVLKAVTASDQMTKQLNALQAQVEQLSGQLEQQKAANKGLIEGMQNQGGGAIMAAQNKPNQLDLSGLMAADNEVGIAREA